MTPVFDLIIHNLNLVTMAQSDEYEIIKDAAVCIKDGFIQSIIPELKTQNGQLESEQVIDAQGHWMTPGLIDCHTHLIYGGNRVDEFEQRLQGVSYEDIAKAGGGILSTVTATRNNTKDELFDQAAKRLSYFIEEGVTTMEIKSGYGLDLATEKKMLEVAKQLDDFSPVEISKTFLGAHAIPTEYAERSDAYIELVCEQMMTELHQCGLIDCVDAFCENIGFTLAQTERVFKAAKQLGLPVKLHAEQLSDIGGSNLAASYKAWSVDHLEFLQEEAISKLARSGTIATLLPGAYYFLRENNLPPIDLLRQYDIPMAIASDSNPGSSPSLSLLMMLNMATTLFKLTPFEALKGVTINAAKALRRDAKIGSIEVGKQADLALWDINSPAELSYRIGGNPCVGVFKKGKLVMSKLKNDSSE